MIDKSDTTNAYGAAAALPSSQVPGVNSQPTLDEGPAWKSAFHRTLVEIQDKGFRSYTDEIQAKKMEELREKILEAMCFNEDDLDNMPSSQREQIEKMVALEIQKRLSAENAIEQDAAQGAVLSGDIATQLRTAPNGLGTGALLIQELENLPKPKDETG